MKHPSLTPERMLWIADHHGFTVHKYRWSHDSKRRMAVKLMREKKVVKVMNRRDEYTIMTPRLKEKLDKWEHKPVEENSCPPSQS